VNDSNPRLRDILVLMLFAVLLRIAEVFERDDTPGWWRQEHDWRLAVDTDALERREVSE
jgi:hypothetical protein